ncbi:MAG TPA: DUF58 domain-containing protein [Ilumatobacteraceae bacterium]|nr:DUF58 domain-containing protein [Ilumatobacteraceae bacterium]
MLTRHGIVVVAAGIAAVVVGRVFAVVELFVIGAAFVGAAVAAVGYVRLRFPPVQADRWVHPSVLVAGDTGRVDLQLRHRGHLRSATFVLAESVRRPSGDQHVARLPMAPMPRGVRTSTGYQLPTTRRGVVTLGPLAIEMSDPLGVARRSRPVVGIDEVTVAPRVHLLDMPQLGQGELGKALLAKAQRLGPGEFHGLREYADGDEPRTIHWKASARTEALMVREYSIEGLHRCTVVFDAARRAHADAEAFERGVTAAASLVHSAARAGLTTRFVSSEGVDLRGPDVVSNTLRVLARIEPADDPPGAIERETGDGLGLVIVVTGSAREPAWGNARTSIDPTFTALLVATGDAGPPGAALSVAATSDEDFVRSWQSLCGRGRLDLVAT